MSRPIRPQRIVPCLAGLLLAASPAALAHTGHGTTGLVAGLLHPFTGLDHLLAMFAVGLWAAQPHQRAAAVWWLPGSFMAALVAGATLGLNGARLAWLDAWLEPGIAGSVLALGLVIALALRLPLVLAMSMAAAFGTLHGYAHGLELPQAASPLPYALGLLLATVALHLGGGLLGCAARHRAAALRIIGGLIAASGAGFLTSL